MLIPLTDPTKSRSCRKHIQRRQWDGKWQRHTNWWHNTYASLALSKLWISHNHEHAFRFLHVINPTVECVRNLLLVLDVWNTGGVVFSPTWQLSRNASKLLHACPIYELTFVISIQRVLMKIWGSDSCEPLIRRVALSLRSVQYFHTVVSVHIMKPHGTGGIAPRLLSTALDGGG
jgi:hypothetical protein